MKYIEKEVTIEELYNMLDGSQKVGDIEVYSKDGYVPVTDVIKTGVKKEFEINLEDGSTIHCCKEHLIETTEGFVPLKNITFSHDIVTESGTSKLESLHETHQCKEMYDLSVEHENHRFLANGISVHNCYGGSAFTLAKNMKTSIEQAEEKIANFFRHLGTLRLWMIRSEKQVKKTGKIYNMFGRERDMSAYVWPDMDAPRYQDMTEKEKKSRRARDRAFAVRSAYNTPIQSTAADFLKLASIKAWKKVRDENWSPLAGLHMPNHIDYSKTSYKDLECALFHSVHDETDFILRDDKRLEAMSEIYKVMQLEEVMNLFNAKFSLELDIEYDETRSWTSTKAIPPALIYLENKLKEEKKWEGVTFLEYDYDCLSEYGLQCIQEYAKDTGDYKISVIKDGEKYTHPKMFRKEDLIEIGFIND